jgi:hypothetical protein
MRPEIIVYCSRSINIHKYRLKSSYGSMSVDSMTSLLTGLGGQLVVYTRRRVKGLHVYCSTWIPRMFTDTFTWWSVVTSKWPKQKLGHASEHASPRVTANITALSITVQYSANYTQQFEHPSLKCWLTRPVFTALRHQKYASCLHPRHSKFNDSQHFTNKIQSVDDLTAQTSRIKLQIDTCSVVVATETVCSSLLVALHGQPIGQRAINKIHVYCRAAQLAADCIIHRHNVGQRRCWFSTLQQASVLFNAPLCVCVCVLCCVPVGWLYRG